MIKNKIQTIRKKDRFTQSDGLIVLLERSRYLKCKDSSAVQSKLSNRNHIYDNVNRLRFIFFFPLPYTKLLLCAGEYMPLNASERIYNFIKKIEKINFSSNRDIFRSRVICYQKECYKNEINSETIDPTRAVIWNLFFNHSCFQVFFTSICLQSYFTNTHLSCCP